MAVQQSEACAPYVNKFMAFSPSVLGSAWSAREIADGYFLEPEIQTALVQSFAWKYRQAKAVSKSRQQKPALPQGGRSLQIQ